MSGPIWTGGVVAAGVVGAVAAPAVGARHAARPAAASAAVSWVGVRGRMTRANSTGARKLRGWLRAGADVPDSVPPEQSRGRCSGRTVKSGHLSAAFYRSFLGLTRPVAGPT